MKALLFSIILFLFFIFTAPAGAGDGDYKKMISEFENFRSGYQPGLLKTEPGPTGLPSSNSIIDAQLNQLQKRWDQLVGRIFEKESFFYYEDGDQVEMEALRTNPDKATDYLKVHPDISSFLKIVFIRNLHLQSVKKKLEAKLESYSQVVQLEDVLSQISSFVKELDTRAGPMRHKKSIQESYPFPGALSLKASIAEQEVRIAKAKYEIVLKDTVTRIKEAIFEWAYLNEALGITEEHLQLLQELEAVASVHFRTGKGGFNDVIKAQIKISKLRDDLINLREKRGVTEAKIVWFINIGSPFVLDFLPAPPLVPVTLSISDLSDVAFRHQQELKLLLEEIKKSQMAIELAEKKYYPDLSPGFSYFENRENPQLGQVKTDQNFKTDPDTRPKYWFGENDAYIREERLNHQS
ncbi:MAG: TolC family protein, partial [Nitrospinales bacterium]